MQNYYVTFEKYSFNYISEDLVLVYNYFLKQEKDASDKTIKILTNKETSKNSSNNHYKNYLFALNHYDFQNE